MDESPSLSRRVYRAVVIVFAGLAAGLALPACTGNTETPSGGGGNGSPGSAGASGAVGTTGGAGTTGSAGTNGSAGTTASAGTNGGGGTTGTAGSAGAAGRGGTTGSSGVTGSTGAAGRGGTTGAGGRGGTTGTAGRGGTTGSGGGPATQMCSGAGTVNANPFGCTFAWGRHNPSGTGSLSAYNYLQSVAFWVEPGVRADGTYTTCSGCNWLTSRVASSNLIPIYYAYMIGFYGHSNGLPDQNLAPNGANLATGGAALIKANRAKVVDMYARYAQQTYAVWSSKPLVWFLEGDFMQYSETSQGSPLTMDELGQLAADITCAIKTNMPNAVVAINHTTWNANDETNRFWTAMKRANYDLVWTTGVGDNGNFIEAAGTPSYYNAQTATYAYVHTFTGKKIAVDTSYGASSMSDSWSNLNAAALNAHIGNGVIGVNISNNAPSNYQQLIQGLGTLASTCD